MAKNSWPSSRASFSALGLSPSVMAMTLLPISLMSDHGKPWAIDSDSTPSLPSMAISLSTKPRIGWRVVWNTPIMRQSHAAITGLVRPSMAPSITLNRSSARSDTSTCGYSLNSTRAVASRKVPSPMLQCRSSSTPTGTSGPTTLRTWARMSLSQSS